HGELLRVHDGPRAPRGAAGDGERGDAAPHRGRAAAPRRRRALTSVEEGAQIGARPSRGTSHDPVRVPSPRPPPGGRGSPSGRARAAAILATLTLACGPSAPDDAGADDGGASDASIDAAGGDAATCLLVRPLESARVDVDGPCA